ncbi:MAG: hypothetical protein A3H96_00885 [Acidobacteria bacterium RIFCSPLOWO2_02_FULL_67_36]|nr:MAG: hypothetical protein A3H96_00885 [Acidobacteria bacterium RIFCSPLOWO2_02_FULL_67_36]OFW23032.1 MAG: hypothetical protein A3G21_00465 [Acidobacteria bacterium RIFCSPLOWO2_12_FULL_66_21]
MRQPSILSRLGAAVLAAAAIIGLGGFAPPDVRGRPLAGTQRSPLRSRGTLTSFVRSGPAARGTARQTPASTQETSKAIDALLAKSAEAQVRGEFAEMQQAAERALDLSRASGDPLRTARALLAIATSKFYQSKIVDAVPLLREGLPLAVAAGDRKLEARYYNGLGLNLRELGEHEEAVDYLRRGLELQRAEGDRLEQSRVLRNIAVLYWMLGDTERAGLNARQAHALAVQAGDVMFQKLTLETVAIQQLAADDPDASVETLNRALGLPPTPQAPLIDMEVLGNLAAAELARGRYDAAVATATRSLDVPQSSGYPFGRAVMYGIVGQSWYRLGRMDEALRWLMKARESWRTLGEAVHPTRALETELWIARVLRRQGEKRAALDIDLALLDGMDRALASTNVNDVSRATAATTAADLYTETIGLLLEQGRIEDGFDASERYHARSFLSTLAESRSGAARALTAGQRTREAALASRASGVQKQLWDPALPAPARASLTRDLAAIDDEFDALRREIRRSNPKYASVRYPALATAAELIAAQPRGSVLLSFVLGDEQSFAWAITGRGITAATLPARSALESQVGAYRRMIARRPSISGRAARRASIERAGRALYHTLIAPLAPAFAGATRAVIIPDGALHLLPFEALVPEGTGTRHRWWVEQVAISEAPSASALKTIDEARRVRPTLQLLAVGAPVYPESGTQGSASRETHMADSGLQLVALPFSRVELEGIASLYPARARRLYAGGAATEDAVKQAAPGGYRYVHFATHAYVNDVRPSRSGIVLDMNRKAKEDGVLQAGEVMALELNADLVTLSACSTGLGKVLRGEGILGLVQAFLYAGSRSVTASLWNVNDAATATLMREFYSGLRRELPRDAALRGAKLRLARSADPRLNDPYYWAPFVLVGSSK